jgi:ABC-type Zn uptake system ZnuABC Zn-binding protein ZnuA
MKKSIQFSNIVGFLILLGIVLSACNPLDNTSQPEPNSELKIVVTTTFIADVVGQVVGETLDITVLLEPGQNPHSYQPTPQDMVLVSQADLIFVNGLDLEEFLDDLLEGSDTEADVVVVSDGIQPLAGLEDHDDHEEEDHGDQEREDHDDQEGEDHDDHEGGYDPHVWFDPNNVITWTENIVAALSALDPEHASEYQTNGQAYLAELIALDSWIQGEIERIPQENRELVTDHTSLSYFAEQYGFTQVGAVIPALTTEVETSGQELAGLIDIIRETETKAIFIGIDFDPTLAEQVAEEAGVDLVPLYFGSLSAGEPAGTYLDFMRYDVNAIVSALQ